MLFICFTSLFKRYARCKVNQLNGKIDIFWPITVIFMTLLTTTWLEPYERRQEFVWFVLPKFVEAVWNFFRLRMEITHPWKYGENVIFGLAMGILLYYYNHEPTSVKRYMYSIFSKLWGKLQCSGAEQELLGQLLLFKKMPFCQLISHMCI
eukprot:TRINITY_DN7683_c0_g1_i2.p2 TRINITY_DN7683_c0_g1~~TRINITY_DN7683_c0_g1_i2.p2  ORF type:complete len:151 (+),score=4.82 TRINITY_DN7683_c0_g1_i2:392-844(+)